MFAIINLPFVRRFVVAGVTMVALATSTFVRAERVTYSGSLQFSTGEYIFTERTKGVSLFSGIAISTKRLDVSASIPIIYQNTPWVSYGGAGTIPSGGLHHSEVGGRGRGKRVTLPESTEGGEVNLGDPLVRADFALLKPGKASTSISLVGQVKIPLADVDQGFGTGEWDFAGGVSLGQVVGKTFWFVDAAYWLLGDLSDLELEDALGYSIAFGLPLAGSSLAALLSLSGSTAIIEDVKPPAQVGVGFTIQRDDGLILTGNAAFGLTESSPDFSLSLGWHVALGG